MPESTPVQTPAAAQPPAEAIAQQLHADASATADAAQALQQAAQTATQIASDIASASPTDTAVAAAPATTEKLPPSSLPPASPAPPVSVLPELQQLLAIEVPIIVQLGVRRLPVGEVMRFALGAIIEFHKAADDELELLANNRPIGKGHAVKVGENFGIRLTAIGPVKETIRKLGTPV